MSNPNFVLSYGCVGVVTNTNKYPYLFVCDLSFLDGIANVYVHLVIFHILTNRYAIFLWSLKARS